MKSGVWAWFGVSCRYADCPAPGISSREMLPTGSEIRNNILKMLHNIAMMVWSRRENYDPNSRFASQKAMSTRMVSV